MEKSPQSRKCKFRILPVDRSCLEHLFLPDHFFLFSPNALARGKLLAAFLGCEQSTPLFQPHFIDDQLFEPLDYLLIPGPLFYHSAHFPVAVCESESFAQRPGTHLWNMHVHSHFYFDALYFWNLGISFLSFPTCHVLIVVVILFVFLCVCRNKGYCLQPMFFHTAIFPENFLRSFFPTTIILSFLDSCEELSTFNLN